MNILNYLIAQEGINWSQPLQTWNWLLPPTFTVWLVNRLADLFLVMEDGTVHMLDVGCGTLEKVADNRDHFCDLANDDEQAGQWFAIKLIDELVAAGMHLQPGQCYGFRIPPVMGGDYSIENLGPLSVTDYLGCYGGLHQQLIKVPDGTQVELKISNLPIPLDLTSCSTTPAHRANIT